MHHAAGDGLQNRLQIAAAGNHELVLLHCVSNYPAAAEDVNLRAMLTMQETFNLPVGYSDLIPVSITI